MAGWWWGKPHSRGRLCHTKPKSLDCGRHGDLARDDNFRKQESPSHGPSLLAALAVRVELGMTNLTMNCKRHCAGRKV
jgi:hypothetical protein